MVVFFRRFEYRYMYNYFPSSPSLFPLLPPPFSRFLPFSLPLPFILALAVYSSIIIFIFFPHPVMLLHL